MAKVDCASCQSRTVELVGSPYISSTSYMRGPKTKQSHSLRAFSGIRYLACIDPTWEPMEPNFPRICRDSKPSLSDGLVHILASITVIVLEDGQWYPMTLRTISEDRQCHSREADLSTCMLPHTCSRVRVRSKSRADQVGVYRRNDFLRY